MYYIDGIRLLETIGSAYLLGPRIEEPGDDRFHEIAK